MLLPSWLKDHEMGMDLCSWFVSMHESASQNLLYVMQLPLSLEVLIVICNYLLGSVPPEFPYS